MTGVEVTGLAELSGSFLLAEHDITPETRKVIAKGALNIKNGMAADARVASPVHAPHFPSSISYDIDETATTVEAEIGPDKDRLGRQGALGNILAFGTANNAPVWDHAAAMEREAEPTERYLADVAERLLS